MTFAKSDWTLSSKDIEQLDKVMVDLTAYQPPVDVHLPIPIPPLGGGIGNMNGVGISDSHSKTTPGMGISSIPQGGRFFRVSQLAALPTPTWLIDHILPKDSLSMVAGPPKSLKSFIVLDWMLSLAIGRDWNGHAVEHDGIKVLYLLGEGKNNLFKRVEVWKREHHLSEVEAKRVEDNFLTSFTIPQVSFPKEVTKLLQDLNNEGFVPTLVVLDTYARAMVGREENSAKETGEATAQMDRLRDQGFTVMYIHHTVKNISKKGATFRGSGSLEAAIDTSFDVARDREAEEVVIKNSNQKDDEEAQPMKMTWKKIYLDLDQTISSLVMVPISDVPLAEQLMGLSLPLSRGDVLKMVKGARATTIQDTLNELIKSGQLTEEKVGKFKMIDRPSQNPNE